MIAALAVEVAMVNQIYFNSEPVLSSRKHLVWNRPFIPFAHEKEISIAWPDFSADPK